jgi:5-bromo-4-chloroindolyl phosphate hydrolysis protein
MQKFETTLDEIEKAFEKQYERNLSDDVRGLDVDLKTLNTMLKEEGL